MVKKSRWKVIYRYICRSSKNPESLARGVGLGLFIGFLPSIGFQVILALFIAGSLNANRIVAVLGTFVSNPFTVLPLGAFSVWLGDWILPGAHLTGELISQLDWSLVTKSSSHLLACYIVGCLILSVTMSCVGYGATKFYFAKIYRG